MHMILKVRCLVNFTPDSKLDYNTVSLKFAMYETYSIYVLTDDILLEYMPYIIMH